VDVLTRPEFHEGGRALPNKALKLTKRELDLEEGPTNGFLN
jgi:hypothetical protein